MFQNSMSLLMRVRGQYRHIGMWESDEIRHAYSLPGHPATVGTGKEMTGNTPRGIEDLTKTCLIFRNTQPDFGYANVIELTCCERPPVETVRG